MQLEKAGERAVLNWVNMVLCTDFANEVVCFMPRGVLGFQVTGMIEWEQKSRPKKIPRASNKTPKNPWTKN